MRSNRGSRRDRKKRGVDLRFVIDGCDYSLEFVTRVRQNQNRDPRVRAIMGADLSEEMNVRTSRQRRVVPFRPMLAGRDADCLVLPAVAARPRHNEHRASRPGGDCVHLSAESCYPAGRNRSAEAHPHQLRLCEYPGWPHRDPQSGRRSESRHPGRRSKRRIRRCRS